MLNLTRKQEMNQCIFIYKFSVKTAMGGGGGDFNVVTAEQQR